jgi:hypothetical protein
MRTLAAIVIVMADSRFGNTKHCCADGMQSRAKLLSRL